MGQIISSIFKNKNRRNQNQKAKNSNSCKNDVIDAYDEQYIGRMFILEFVTEAKKEGHQLKKETIQLQAMDSRKGKNSSDKENYVKVFGNSCVGGDRGYDDVISHLKLVISTTKGEGIPMKCYRSNSIKPKGGGRRARIQTTIL